jgi:quaternary ammonium compound-resistance protein SugE
MPAMGWIVLAVAGACEVGFTTALKYSDGLTRPIPSLIFIVFTFASMWLLAQAVKTIPLGTAYAVWTGIGAVGTAIVGIAIFEEPATAARLSFLALIIVGIVGIVGLKWVSP